MSARPLPLFPLNTVLLPGGRLSLRVFEPRYLDLVRDCTRQASGFGICLILDGEEVGAPALPAACGCEARIVDFASTEGGLLGITVQGERRFHVLQTRVRDNGLITAEVEWLAESPTVRIRPEHQLLSLLLAKLLDRASIGYSNSELEDADWVGWRMAEWLPLTMVERQALLVEDDPHQRLQRLVEHVPRFQAA
jgi:Lon protease-like protein